MADNLCQQIHVFGICHLSTGRLVWCSVSLRGSLPENILPADICCKFAAGVVANLLTFCQETKEPCFFLLKSLCLLQVYNTEYSTNFTKQMRFASNLQRTLYFQGNSAASLWQTLLLSRSKYLDNL